jgi:hypothetical protein
VNIVMNLWVPQKVGNFFKMAVFWDIAECSLIEVCWCSRCLLPLLGWMRSPDDGGSKDF